MNKNRLLPFVGAAVALAVLPLLILVYLLIVRKHFH